LNSVYLRRIRLGKGLSTGFVQRNEQEPWFSGGAKGCFPEADETESRGVFAGYR
jgi:hypothetical protein